MLEKIREKLLAFISSPKDVPLLAGFSVGLYMLLFYYSKNFSLANSLTQLMFFTAYYIIMPMLVLFILYRLTVVTKFSGYRQHVLFVGIIAFFSYFFIQLSPVWFSKKAEFALIVTAAILLSIRFHKYYKLLIILLFFISVFNLKELAKVSYIALTSSSDWKKQPDNIEGIRFKKKPNIYYIQPDGYTSFSNLRKPPYNFDNSQFEEFLKSNGFKMYDDFHSNYFSTLLSNASMFSMKHHFIQKDVDMYASRSVIIGDNPVLHIFKKNNYKTSFISEKPYLIMNRPKMGYDYSNIAYGDIPFIKDGWEYNYDAMSDFKSQMAQNGDNGNFYFIEKFSPGHIHGFKSHSEGVEKEKDNYIKSLKEANVWLKELISSIQAKDPGGLIIIGADHGGYAGFAYTLESLNKTTDTALVNSIYGAHLSIKWNEAGFDKYDAHLKSSVNLFRVIFSYLAQDDKYLNAIQDNSSYIRLSQPKGLYRYINNEGNVVFEKI